MMTPYIEYANNDAILHAVFLEAIEDIGISNDYILLNYRDGDTNTNNIVRAGHSSCPILQDVIDELNDWKQKLKSGQTRKYSFSITNSIMKHEETTKQLPTLHNIILHIHINRRTTSIDRKI